MSLPPIRTIVIGSPDGDASAGFWSAFGYAPLGPPATGPAGALVLSCGRGANIVITPSNGPGPVRGGWDLGPRGLDVYVADIDEAIARLVTTGLSCGPVATVEVGPVRMRQCAVLGPSGEPVVLVESSHRRPSLLDAIDSSGPRWCSEVYSVVWCVPSRDDQMRTLAASGAHLGPPLAFSDSSLGAYLSLPDDDAILEMVTVGDAEGTPTRLELLSFPGRAHRSVVADAGVTAIEFADGDRWTVDRR